MKQNDLIPTALITSDEHVRALFQDDRVRGQLDVVMEVAGPLASFGPDRREELTQRDPGLVFLDLEDEAGIGCRLAQSIAIGLPPRRIVAVGPMQPPEFLMQAMQSGISEYLTKPVSGETVAAAIDRARLVLAPRSSSKPRTGQLISFFGPRGGTGATTVATNLGIELHRSTGSRTVIVDLNLELGELAVFLGLEPRYHVVDVANSLHRMDEGLLGSFIEKHPSGVSVLAAPYHPGMADDVSVEQIGRILTLLRGHFDHILVDGLKTLTPRTLRAFELSNEIFVIIQQDVLSVQGIQRCQPLFQRLQHSGHTFRLLVNRYDPHHEITIHDLEQSLEMEVFWTLPNDYESVAHSINTGKPLTMASGSSFARDLEGLAAQISGSTTTQLEFRGRLGGVFGRLRDRLGGGSSAAAASREAYLLSPSSARE